MIKSIVKFFGVVFFLLPVVCLAMPSHQIETHKQSHHEKKPLKNLQSKYWTVQFGLGGGRYNEGTDGEHLKVTQTETDLLSERDKIASLSYIASVQFIVPTHHNSFIAAIGLGPTVYYMPAKFSGEVYQFKMPALNNYTYDFRVKPLNIYFEMDVYFKSFYHHRITPYVFAGAGASIVKMSYEEQVTPAALSIGVPSNSRISLDSKWDEQFAYELGLGVNIKLPHHFFLGARYVYQHSNHAQLSGSGILSPLTVHQNSHMGFITLGFSFA